MRDLLWLIKEADLIDVLFESDSLIVIQAIQGLKSTHHFKKPPYLILTQQQGGKPKPRLQPLLKEG